MGRRRSRPARRGSGRRSGWPIRSTCCSSTRPVRCRWPTSLAMAAGDGQHRAARRSAAARPAAAGHPPDRVRSARRSATCAGRRRHDRRRTTASSSRRPGGCTRPCTAFTSEVFYDDRLESEATSPGRRVRSRLALVDGVGPRLVAGCDRRVRTASRRRRPTRSRSSPGLIVGGVRGPTRRAPPGSLSWGDVLIVAPYNAQVGGHPATAADRRPASAPSTSSRARRRRSSSTR